MNEKGASVVEAIAATVILAVGIASAAGISGAAAKVLARARAMDQSHEALAEFVDSVFADARRPSGRQGPAIGQRTVPTGRLRWEIPHAVGARAWVEFSHFRLNDALRIEFTLPARP